MSAQAAAAGDRPVTFYFDFVSPYSYLAFHQISNAIARTHATMELVPIHVLTVMDQVGNVPTSVTCAAKAAYALQDLGRWARACKLPLSPHPGFGKFSTEPFLLGALAASADGQLQNYATATFSAIWGEPKDLANDAAVVEWLNAGGVTGARRIWETREEFKGSLVDNHARAISDGVFGVPSFKTPDALFFGNDRIESLEEHLRA